MHPWLLIFVLSLGLFLPSPELRSAPHDNQAGIKIASQAIIRLEGPIFQPKINPQGTLLAYSDTAGRSLRVLDLKTHDVIEVTPHRVGPAFFWSPDGVRLFYRELINKDRQVESLLQAFDSHLKKSILLQTIEGSSGYLTYAPYLQTAYLMHAKGILAKRLDFPGLRQAAWQKKKPQHEGQWVATQGSILWLTDLGLTLKKMEDDGSGVESFAISPDGQSIAWATLKGMIFVANAAHPEAQRIEKGRDPAWHPYLSLLVFAASRLVGKNTYDTDLKVSDLHTPARFLQSTPDLAERWPLWVDSDTIIHTAQGTTDLIQLRLQPQSPLAKTQNREAPPR